MRRRALAIGAVAVVLVTAVTVAMASGTVVHVKGTQAFEPNALIYSTFRFSPERIVVSSGDRMRFEEDASFAEPHTVTVVEPTDVPKDAAEVFMCEACNDALNAHFGSGGLVRRVEDDADDENGLDGPGDSLFFNPEGDISVTVTAPAGTRLRFLCAIHPWMQGKIKVVD